MPDPGINGLLGTRASLMLDVVDVALALVLPAFRGSESTAVGGAAENWVDFVLAIHVLFAATTAVLWSMVIVLALRHSPHPPVPKWPLCLVSAVGGGWQQSTCC